RGRGEPAPTFINCDQILRIVQRHIADSSTRRRVRGSFLKPRKVRMKEKRTCKCRRSPQQRHHTERCSQPLHRDLSLPRKPAIQRCASRRRSARTIRPAERRIPKANPETRGPPLRHVRRATRAEHDPYLARSRDWISSEIAVDVNEISLQNFQPFPF